MTGHRVALRAGVVATLAAALLTVFPAPAPAQPQGEVRLGGIGDIELRVGGGGQNVTIQVENRGELPAVGVRLTMTVPLSDLGVHIASAPGECNRVNDNTRMDCVIEQIAGDATHTIVTQVGVDGNSSLQAGETRNGSAEVVLAGGGSQSYNVRLQGPDRPQGVPEVSGFVTDQASGERIEGATVLLVDSQNAEFSRTTNANGEFSFTGEDIAPGSVGLQASKNGYEGQQFIEQGQAGQPLTGIQLTMTSTASPTPSASPTPAASPTPTSTAIPAPVADTGGSGGSFFTTLLVIIGIVFVLLGVGAIVVLIIRRRRERGEEDGLAGDDDPTSGPRGPGPTPGSHGVYRPSPTAAHTQVIGGRGGPVPAVGPSPALADAPTMLHRRAGAADETTMLPRAGDPPGPRPPIAGNPPPPRPAAPTYGAATTAYQQPTTGYQQPTTAYQQPTTAYQQPTTAYQPTAGHDEPRGGRHDGGTYGTPPDRTEVGGYGAAPAPPSTGRHGHGGYGPDPYTQPSPYDQPGHRDQGYPGQGYPDQGQPTEGYGGHERTGGHRADPYGGQTHPSYGQPEYGQAGHSNDQYDDQAGEPRSRHAAEPPERRRLDWLDDT